MRLLGLAISALLIHVAQAQWTIQRSNTTADLRGIHSVGRGVAWVSGTRGTVLRTTDGGETWQPCSVPPGANDLDFRGIQGFNEKAAIVMSSGKGDLSRLYKTDDACLTWKAVFTNPDEKGFWDAIQFSRPGFGVLIGDPVDGYFAVFSTSDGGNTWRRLPVVAPAAAAQSLFAASNTALLVDGNMLYFVTGGGVTSSAQVNLATANTSYTQLPLAAGESAGAFSLASRPDRSKMVFVAVGGDYRKPDETAGTAAFLTYEAVGGGRWHATEKAPGGYRSAVVYDMLDRIWIAVGPNGTDMSGDDGRTWQPLKPLAGQPPDSARNWNALSLPFAVGPKGRIGKLARHGAK